MKIYVLGTHQKYTQHMISWRMVFLFLLINIFYEYSLELLQWVHSNEYIKHMFCEEIGEMFKKIRVFFFSAKKFDILFFDENIFKVLIVLSMKCLREVLLMSTHNICFHGKWYFSYSAMKHMLWVLIRSASMRHFQWVTTTYVFIEK